MDDIVVQEFVNSLKPTPTDTNTTYGATVSRVDDEGTVWVNIYGSDKETPTASTSSEVKRGDTVTVNWRNNKLYIGGNYSNPSAGVERVGSVEKVAASADKRAIGAQESADKAQETADGAKKIAGNTNQYFWVTETGTDTGAHITEIPQEEFLQTPSGGNLLARSNGIAVRAGLTEVAFFGETARIGKEAINASRTLINAGGMQVLKRDSSDTDLELANIGYGSGNAETGSAYAPYYTLGSRTTGGSRGNYSMAEGKDVEASGYCSHAEGYQTVASGHRSHAEGNQTVASGLDSHAEGTHMSDDGVDYFTAASGIGSHAEGIGTQATNNGAHSEGYRTLASGNSSHAEGSRTKAVGAYSHAEGGNTEARGEFSHAGGEGTIADAYQTAIGTYNKFTQSVLFVIGNGDTENARSNAFTVDTLGDTYTAGKYYFGSYEGAKRELRAIRYATVDTPTVTINANNTGTFTATITPPSGYDVVFVTGFNLRSVGNNYSRINLYGGETVDNGDNTWTFTCYGRNTYTANATGLSVRIRVLYMTPLD